MHTIQNTLPTMAIAGIDIGALNAAPDRPLPHFLTLPLIGLTSVGLWFVIYKVGCSVISLLT